MRATASPKAMGLQHAATQLQMSDAIESAGDQGGRAERRARRRNRGGRRLDIGRPRNRLYPQAGLASKQRFGLVPIPTVVDGLTDDDED
jgi:hypothetical protein